MRKVIKNILIGLGIVHFLPALFFIWKGIFFNTAPPEITHNSLFVSFMIGVILLFAGLIGGFYD